jgi:hypothetical protein
VPSIKTNEAAIASTTIDCQLSVTVYSWEDFFENGFNFDENGVLLGDIFPFGDFANAYDAPMVSPTGAVVIAETIRPFDRIGHSQIRAVRSLKENSKVVEHLEPREFAKASVWEIITSPNLLSFSDFALSAPQGFGNSSEQIGSGPGQIAAEAGGENIRIG